MNNVFTIDLYVGSDQVDKVFPTVDDSPLR